MPQREFWTQRIPTRMQWTYDVDPRDPESTPTLLANVSDQAHGSMDSMSVRVPFNVLHEAVGGLLVATWEAYLFGEVGDVSTTMQSTIKRWRRESGPWGGDGAHRRPDPPGSLPGLLNSTTLAVVGGLPGQGPSAPAGGSTKLSG